MAGTVTSPTFRTRARVGSPSRIRSPAVMVTAAGTGRRKVFSAAQSNSWEGRYQVMPSHQYPPARYSRPVGSSHISRESTGEASVSR